MDSNENNGSGIGLGIAHVNSEDSVEEPRPRPPLPTEPALAEDSADAQQPRSHADYAWRRLAGCRALPSSH